MELQKRKLVQMILGFFLGRVSIFGINPIGIAFFASGYMETGIRIPLGISVLFGMFTAFPVETVLCHMMVMISVIFAIDFLEKRNIRMQMVQTMLLLLVILGIVTFLRLYFFSYDSMEKFATIVECFLSVAATRVLYDGQHFLLQRKKGQYPGNEELLSIVLLGMFVALGLPDISFYGLTPVRLAVYFFTLLVGYCFGTGAGAMAGTIGGLCLMTIDENTAMVGTIAVMGILAGLLRSQKKVVLCIGYFWGILGCSFFIQTEVFPYGDFLNAGLAGGLFFLVPERFFGKAVVHSGRWEDYWESEKLQEMLRYKLSDFAESFVKLSKTLEQGIFSDLTDPDGEISGVLAATSEQVCGQCENADNCGGHLALLKPDNLSEVSVSEENGRLKVSRLPYDFIKECVHQDYFIWEANQNIHLANTMNYFQNKILYHKQATVEQMREVGEILEGLTKQMPKVLKIPLEVREELKRELKKARIKAEEIAFYEKYDGRMEVYMTGRTSRGRCVTTREAEIILSVVLDRPVRALETCRKVFPVKKEEFVFRETAKLKAETGISRMSKRGEKISGDTFSCMELSNGKFLLALSDGMGSGKDAYTESERVMELLEQMTDVGFSGTAAVKLINSLYIAGERERNFATADITLLNLYQKTAQFIKCGASTTYLYHEKELLPVEGEALPIGIMSRMEPYVLKTGINTGDYVIMMTDGVSDSFSIEGNDLEEILWEMLEKQCSAQELAEAMIEEATGMWGGKPQDDMSVLVVKLFYTH